MNIGAALAVVVLELTPMEIMIVENALEKVNYLHQVQDDVHAVKVLVLSQELIVNANHVLVQVRLAENSSTRSLYEMYKKINVNYVNTN